MCSYCGCESDAVLAELVADHEQIGLLARRAEAALHAGDSAEATALCGEIAALFDAHGAKEEEGLFSELRAEGEAQAAVSRLEAEHRYLEVGLAQLAAGDLTSLGRVLAFLVDHADREDTDVFPAALLLLPNDAWSRIHKTIRPA